MNRHFSSGLGTQLRQGLGTKLAGVRRALGLTQGRLARLVGCAPWVIGRCERGEHCPKVEVLVALRTALNVSLDYPLVSVRGDELALARHFQGDLAADMHLIEHLRRSPVELARVMAAARGSALERAGRLLWLRGQAPPHPR